MQIGIDLGGTKIAGIVLNDGQVLVRERIETPRGSAQQILQAIHALILTLEAAVDDSCTVGICGPGSLNRQGFIRNSNTTEFNGIALQSELEKLSGREIRFSNDANCFALAEAVCGAGREFNTVFGAILGTGCGGGLIIDKKIIAGLNGIGGEWGHNPLTWMKQQELQEQRVCFCGQLHCNETYISGSGLSYSYALQSGKRLSAKEVLTLSEQGDTTAMSCVDAYLDQLARALSAIINVFDPECIVLGGGLSQVSRIYQEVPEIWGKYIFSESVATRLLPPHGGDSAGALGAAWLWHE